MIEIRNVTKKYIKGNDSFTALEDVTITIRRGDYCKINGSSGAGKSTLLYSIGGLIKPDSGTVLFEDHDLYYMGRRYLDTYRKQKVGFMFQQFHLMPYLTVIENIKLAGNSPTTVPLINQYLEKCSLSGLKNKYPSELSVGEKQRTAFIRAIISDPVMLLADEPTGNLDPVNSKVLMSLIGDYHKKGGTVILVSHDPAAAASANLKFTLEKGKILPS